MIERGEGSIVIIGSTACDTLSYRETAYRISKMGLRTYRQNLAIEMAPYGIRVNLVTPGHFPTRLTSHISPEIEQKMLELIPAHRFGNPVEIGYAAAMLLSNRVSGYTYGAELVVDGGLSLRPLPLYSEEEIRNMNLTEGSKEGLKPS